jgi:hypothetical protein
VKKIPDGLRKELEYHDLYLTGEETERTKDAVSGLPSDASNRVWENQILTHFPAASTLVSAAELGEKSQDFEVQPNKSDHQSKAAVPFHVLRGTGTGTVLDKIEIQH